MKDAIEKAIEGGYVRGNIGYAKIKEVNLDWVVTDNLGTLDHYGIAWILLDPLF